MPNPRRPDELKVITGTFRRDRADPAGAPHFGKLTEFPPAPQHLNADGAAMWRELLAELGTPGVIQASDVYALEQLCYAWQRFRKNSRAGVAVKSSEQNALRSLFAEFGLSPAARHRVISRLSRGAR